MKPHDAAITRPSMRRFVAWIVRMVALIGCTLVCTQTVAHCLDGKKMMGVNLAGAEFNAKKLPGVVFKDYVYPEPADMLYFQTLGMNVFRLPFLWERVQPNLFGELDQAELRRIQTVVANARALDVCVILDVHNYGEYRGRPIGSDEVPAAAFFDLWRRLLAVFKTPADTAFGLMNEPSKLSIAEWAAVAQETVMLLRKDGAKHLILVPGGRWSGAHDWHAQTRGASNADAFRAFHDPAGNFAIEVHQYADADFSGTGSTCVDLSRLRSIMARVTQWAQANRYRLFLGEFGVPANEYCLKALEVILDAVNDNAEWRGSTYWAAGRWWGGYPFSIQPDRDGDKRQTAVLKNYARRQ